MAHVTYDLLQKITFYVKCESNNHMHLLSYRMTQYEEGQYAPFYSKLPLINEEYSPFDNYTDK